MLLLVYVWMFLILLCAAIWRTIPPFKDHLSPFNSRWKKEFWETAREEIPETQLLTEHREALLFAFTTLINWIASPVITVIVTFEFVKWKIKNYKVDKFCDELNEFLQELEETLNQYKNERTYVTSLEIAHILKDFTDKFQERWHLHPEADKRTFNGCVTAIMQDLMAASKGKLVFSGSRPY